VAPKEGASVGVSMISGSKSKLQVSLALTTLVVVALEVGCTGFFVNPTLQQITVTPQTPQIQQGKTLQMGATGTFDDGSTKNITGKVQWSSDNTTVASVGTSTGLVTANTLGTTTVTATSATITGSTTATVVLANIQSIAVTPTNTSVTQGNTKQFMAVATTSNGTTQDITSSATWNSSNTNVVTIDATGLATALAVTTSQTVTISASSGGVTGSTNLTVNP
jgi:trimeric autotransporter adhesin